jgi:hypothetical protein
LTSFLTLIHKKSGFAFNFKPVIPLLDEPSPVYLNVLKYASGFEIGLVAERILDAFIGENPVGGTYLKGICPKLIVAPLSFVLLLRNGLIPAVLVTPVYEGPESVDGSPSNQTPLAPNQRLPPSASYAS